MKIERIDDIVDALSLQVSEHITNRMSNFDLYDLIEAGKLILSEDCKDLKHLEFFVDKSHLI